MKRANSKDLRKQFKHLACSRCGHLQGIELHHKVHFVSGGSNEKSNLIPLCKGCHDYQHARENIIAGINSELKRLAVLHERLRVLDRENSPQSILKRGYQSYFKDFNEYLPPRNICARY